MEIDLKDAENDTPHLLSTPPRGLALVVWVAVFLILGSTGHDPWKVDDAAHFGVIWSMLENGLDWVPRIADTPHLEFPPLYYWAGTAMSETLGWLLPAHDAARLTSGVFAVLLLVAVSHAARRWHGDISAAPAVLLTLGSLGLMVHSHETQPMMAVIAAAAVGYLGFAQIDRHPVRGGLLAGLSLAGLFLSGGAVASLLLAPMWVLGPALLPGLRNRASLWSLLGSLLFGVYLIAAFLFGFKQSLPDIFRLWVDAEWRHITPRVDDFERFRDWGKLMLWFVWPVWPIAAWTLWKQRRHLDTPALRLPLLFTLVALVVVLFFSEVRSARALPLIAPLVLLASAGLPTLRRGAANALDWFGVMTFGLLGFFVWFAWNALANGAPERFARNLDRLAPGYVFDFSLVALGLALTLGLSWTWLVMNSPRSPYRAITHWVAGVILFWGSSTLLIFPWINYGKSYRPVVAELQRVLRVEPRGCIAGATLGPAQRASLDYFARIQPRVDHAAISECRLLLLQTTRDNRELSPGAQWSLRWEGQRPGDRNETLRLYVRG